MRVTARLFKLCLVSVALMSFAVILGDKTKTEAACAANTANLGTATGTFSIPTSGTYRVWSRIQPDSINTANNSYTLELDSGTVAAGSATCNITVGDVNLPANTWTWVDYRDGNSTSKINVALTAGTHSYTLYGRETGVELDRVIFSADSTCIPSGNGDNCANSTFPVNQPPADTTKPTVSITSPAPNVVISGSSLSIQATAADNVAIQNVQFYMDGVLLGTDTQSPYSFSLNTTLYTNGAHSLTAIASDTSNNTQTSTAIPVTITNSIPDTTKPSITITAPLVNATISGLYVVNANASDAGGMARVNFSLDGGAVRLSDTTVPYSYALDTTALTKGAHTITVTAYDTSGNFQAATVNITVDNTAPAPTAASCGFSGVVGVSQLVILLSSYNKSVPKNTKGDCSGDGSVGITDLVILLGLYGK